MKKQKRVIIAYSVAFVLLVIAVLINVYAGSVKISPAELWQLLLTKQGDALSYDILWEIRLPRILAALFLGGALALSGYLLQTFFGNPIAGPYILGVSQGAKLFVALAMIFFMGQMNSFLMTLLAFLGSLVAMAFVLLVSTKVERMSMLIVCGVMIGYICSAITDFVVTFASDQGIVNLHNWSKGSFSSMNWADVQTIVWMIGLSFCCTFLLCKPISAYLLGEGYAQTVGVNVKLLRVVLILLSSVLSGCVTAFAGPISFVGIAVPHLTKGLFRSSKPIVIIPGCFLMGAVVTLFCDFVARCAFAPTEMSISSVTAIFLVPVVIVMMMKKQRGV